MWIISGNGYGQEALLYDNAEMGVQGARTFPSLPN